MAGLIERLDGLEETQAVMLELLRGMGSGTHTTSNGGGASTLSGEMEAALQHTMKDIRKAMTEKSSHEQAALLEAIRATLTGVHKREKKHSIHLDPAGYEHSIVLASYSPAEVVHRFASMDEPKPLDAPERDDFIGAVGFVDVSGFTKLSEKLQKEHGRKGAELLNKYVNAYFARLIDGINKYAGDVIKFAGDALQVVWRNRPDGAQDSAATLMLRASACCLFLLENLNGFSPSEGVSLTLHMGVGVGPMSAFYVGGEGAKWEYFVAGEPIEQMSDAAEEAVSGQLVISKASLGCFAVDGAAHETYALEGKKLASEQYLLEGIRGGGGGSAVASFQKRSLLDGLRDSLTARGPELEPILRCFVPQLVEERLDAGQSGSAIHEHRKLVSVFMKAGTTTDDRHTPHRTAPHRTAPHRTAPARARSDPRVASLPSRGHHRGPRKTARLCRPTHTPPVSPPRVCRCSVWVRSRATSRISRLSTAPPRPRSAPSRSTTAPSRGCSPTTRGPASSSPSGCRATSTTTTRSAPSSRPSSWWRRSTASRRGRSPTSRPASCSAPSASRPASSSAARRAGRATASSTRWRAPRSTWRRG